MTIISTIGAFKAFNEIYTMSMAAFPGGQATAGGPIGSTQTVVVYVYNQFYSSQRLGYGSAVAFLLFAVILGLTLVQLSIGRRRGGERAAVDVGPEADEPPDGAVGPDHSRHPSRLWPGCPSSRKIPARG